MYLLGTAVSLSGDGSRLAVGGIADDGFTGATWIFIYNSSSASYHQSGSKILMNGTLGSNPCQGRGGN